MHRFWVSTDTMHYSHFNCNYSEVQVISRPLWIAAPVQGTGYQFPQVKEQVPPIGRTGHQSRVKEQVTHLSGEQVTDFVIPLS